VGHRGKRRARVLGSEASLAAKDVSRILEEQDRLCFYCSADIEDGRHISDHFIPLDRGGSNWPDNIVDACSSCHAQKANRLPLEYVAYRQRIGDPLPKHAIERIERRFGQIKPLKIVSDAQIAADQALIRAANERRRAKLRFTKGAADGH
jgi:hypothetical protein